jgi:hypothetical protein
VRSYAVVVAILALALGACSAESTPGPEDGTSSSGLCAARLVVDGRTYDGIGGLRRDPGVTGSEIRATMPGCDDTGGEPSPDEAVTAQVLAEVPPETALLYQGDVYVREGKGQDAQLQERLRHWRTSPQCSTPGTFELTGTWLGVDGPHEPELDGDIRPPYRLTIHVERGPAAYTRAQVVVRVTEMTSPVLDRSDVETSLWAGGSVTADVRCDGARFVALGVRSHAP